MAPIHRQNLMPFGTRSTPSSRSSQAARCRRTLGRTVPHARHWPDEPVVRLRLLADVFAHALVRQRAEHAAQKAPSTSDTWPDG